MAKIEVQTSANSIVRRGYLPQKAENASEENQKKCAHFRTLFAPAPALPRNRVRVFLPLPAQQAAGEGSKGRCIALETHHAFIDGILENGYNLPVFWF